MKQATTRKALALLLVLVFALSSALSACTYDPHEGDETTDKAPAAEATASAVKDTESEKARDTGISPDTVPATSAQTETEPVSETETETEKVTETKAKTEPPETKEPETDAPVPDQTEPADTEAPEPRQATEPLPDNADEVFARTVYVGDSICSGFRVYGILPPNNNLAVGNVGARSIFDYSFSVNGAGYDLITALKLVDPAFVVFSMGMNDINMTSEQQYCANYDNILAQVHAAIPNAKLFVASITPTRNTQSFRNERIDLFNDTIKDHLSGTGYYYIDINSALRDPATGSLNASYDGGDGIHLAPAAYHVIKSVTYSYFKSIGAVS